MIEFAFKPAFLLLLPVIAYVLFKIILSRVQRAGVRFSSTRNAALVRKSLKSRLMIIPFVLRILALVLLVFCLARPQVGVGLIKEVNQGIAIEMVIDRSSSMMLKKKVKGEWIDRLTIVKRVFSDFVNGDGDKLDGRPSDLIGMISFARYPDTLAPLTHAHGALNRFLETLKLVPRGSDEDGTSIGDAIELGAARLATAEEIMNESPDQGESQDNFRINSKVMILLSDGEDTGIGDSSPRRAAEQAKKWGVKIYAIIIAGSDWYIEDEDIFGRKMMARVNARDVDTREMEEVAEITGGLFRLVDDYSSLLDVYREIDALEKSEIPSERYLDTKELYLIPGLIALLLLAFEMILSSTVFRRIP